MRRARGLLLAPLFTGACGGVEVISPSEGSVQRSPWIAVMANLGEGFVGGTATTWLDGEENTDSLGFVRRRVSFHGGGADYLATLDLTDLAPGEHHLELRFEGRGLRRQRAEVNFRYEPPPCEVVATVVDERGEPTSARLLVLDEQGRRVELAGPDAARVDARGRDANLHQLIAVHGEARGFLERGRYALVAIQGLRDHIDQVEVDCTEADRVEAAFTLRPAFEDGALGADLHLHSGRSGDSSLPDRVRWRAVVASGLDLVVLSDHNQVHDPRGPLAEILDGHEGTRGLPGNEARIGYADPAGEEGEESGGHLNAFPLRGEDLEPLPDTWTEVPAPQLEAYRARQVLAPFDGSDELVLQLNHPRGVQFFPDVDIEQVHDLFNVYGFDNQLPLQDPTNAWLLEENEGGTRNIDFDTIELINRFSWPLYKRARADWFALLNQGVWLTGTGSSDSHAFEVETLGFPMNLIDCPRPVPGEEVDSRCVVRALKEGRVGVSTGPVVTMAVAGSHAFGAPGDLVEAIDGEVRVKVRVRAAPWVPVEEIRLVVDGLVVQRLDLSRTARDAEGVLDRTETFSRTLDHDAWVLAEAGWSPAVEAPAPEDMEAELGLYALIAPGQLPVGFTNPVRIEVDGDGVWVPPGL